MSLTEYKVAVCGPGATGKSALTIQYVQNKFLDSYDPTIEDSYRKQVKIDGSVITLEILDTAGQDEYKALRDSYMRNCAGFLCVFDLTHIKTLHELSEYIDNIKRVKDAETYPIVICGNKSDLASEREVNQKDVDEFLTKYWKMPFVETSAKLGQNVEECFNTLLKEIKQKTPTGPTVQTKKGKKEHGGGCLIL